MLQVTAAALWATRRIPEGRLTAPGMVYALAAVLALVSLMLAFLVPRHPVAGRETVLGARASSQAGV